MSGLARRNPRRDANEKQICRYLDDLSVPWWTMSGKGIPDLLILHKGDWKLIEVKNKGGRNRMTPPQKDFRARALTWDAKYYFIVTDLDDLMLALQM